MVAQALQVAVLCISIFASAWLWVRIARSRDPILLKAGLFLLVAIPVLGPLLWLFLDMPGPRTDAGRLPLPFQGPVDPAPTSPKWAANAYWTLIVLGGVFFASLHACLLVLILR
jgi:hypothetical protein